MSSASSSNASITVTDLCTALEYPPSIKAQDIPLSEALKSIFRSEHDLESLSESKLSEQQKAQAQEKIILNRFDEARRLYQLVMKAEPPPDHAYFYKLVEEYKLQEQIASLRSSTSDVKAAQGQALRKQFEEDYKNAKKQGKVYAPKDHNWGVNAAWVLALARRSVPIQIVSDLDSREKTIYSKHDPSLPSAFTLEIAMMRKMGYTPLVGEQGKVELIPPASLREEAHKTSGAENGALPSPEDQIKLYLECLEKVRQQRFEAFQHRPPAASFNATPTPPTSSAAAASVQSSIPQRVGRFEVTTIHSDEDSESTKEDPSTQTRTQIIGRFMVTDDMLFGFQNYQASENLNKTLGTEPKLEEKQPTNPKTSHPKKHP